MNRRSLLALLSLTAVAPAFAQQKKPAAKQRVIFQVSDNDPAKWNLALNNAKNVLVDLGKENVQIEIVAYGPGLAMLKAESPVAAAMRVCNASSSSIVLTRESSAADLDCWSMALRIAASCWFCNRSALSREVFIRSAAVFRPARYRSNSSACGWVTTSLLRLVRGSPWPRPS